MRLANSAHHGTANTSTPHIFRRARFQSTIAGEFIRLFDANPGGGSGCAGFRHGKLNGLAWRRIASATAPALPYLLHPCSRAGIRPTYIVKNSKIYANHYIIITPYTRTHSGRSGIADSRDASPLSGAAASSQSLISRKWSSASEPIASKKRIRFLI
jgi:hypothetical protein